MMAEYAQAIVPPQSNNKTDFFQHNEDNHNEALDVNALNNDIDIESASYKKETEVYLTLEDLQGAIGQKNLYNNEVEQISKVYKDAKKVSDISKVIDSQSFAQSLVCQLSLGSPQNLMFSSSSSIYSNSSNNCDTGYNSLSNPSFNSNDICASSFTKYDNNMTNKEKAGIQISKGLVSSTYADSIILGKFEDKGVRQIHEMQKEIIENLVRTDRKYHDSQKAGIPNYINLIQKPGVAESIPPSSRSYTPIEESNCIRNRDVLKAVDYICQVVEKESFNLDTLYVAVSLFHRFLSVKQMLRSEVKLLSAACIFLAAKYEENYGCALGASGICSYYSNKFSKPDLFQAEKAVLMCLDFHISISSASSPRQYLKPLIKDLGLNTMTGLLANYLSELTLTDPYYLNYTGYEIALASLGIAVLYEFLMAYSQYPDPQNNEFCGISLVGDSLCNSETNNGNNHSNENENNYLTMDQLQSTTRQNNYVNNIPVTPSVLSIREKMYRMFVCQAVPFPNKGLSDDMPNGLETERRIKACRECLIASWNKNAFTDTNTQIYRKYSSPKYFSVAKRFIPVKNINILIQDAMKRIETMKNESIMRWSLMSRTETMNSANISYLSSPNMVLNQKPIMQPINNFSRNAIKTKSSYGEESDKLDQRSENNTKLSDKEIYRDLNASAFSMMNIMPNSSYKHNYLNSNNNSNKMNDDNNKIIHNNQCDNGNTVKSDVYCSNQYNSYMQDQRLSQKQPPITNLQAFKRSHVYSTTYVD